MTTSIPQLTALVSTLGRMARAALLAMLMLCEPVIRPLCVTVSVLGVLMSLLFESSSAGPTFPCLRMIGVSLSFAVVLAVYSSVVALLLGRDRR